MYYCNGWAHSDITTVTEISFVPDINALSDIYYALQAMTDILTISEVVPKLDRIKVAWVGDAPNVLDNLTIACAKLGIYIHIATSTEYPMDPKILNFSREASRRSGTILKIFNRLDVAVNNNIFLDFHEPRNKEIFSIDGRR
jgi:ornithine carbamoyltransferase